MPKLSDPAGAPRFPFQRAAKREKPIWTREQFGPWRCDVRVTPITGMRKSRPVFEVRVSWENGPALDESLGPAPPTGMAGVDVYVVDREVRDMQLTGQQAVELAVAIARAAADQLQDGIKPDLFRLARQLHLRLK